MKSASKIWQATGVAAGALLTILAMTAVAAAFASCSGCAPSQVRPSVPDRAEHDRAAIARAFDATVRVVVFKNGNGKVTLGGGSGVLVARGKVLTALHVATGVGDKVLPMVVHSYRDFEKAHPATLRAQDEASDLALLDVPELYEQGLPVARELPPRFSRVTLIGSPGGVWGNVSEGFFVGTVRLEGMPSAPQMDGAETLSITGGFLIPGSSGGPIVDREGRLVGLSEACEMMATPKEMPDLPIGQIAFATPLPAIREFLKKNGVLR